MDSEPITEEDLDDLRETSDPSGNCMVCLNPCKSWSNDLFLYTCRCIYRVHPECFKEWRVLTKTNRVCLICRDEFDTFGYVQEDLDADVSGLIVDLVLPEAAIERAVNVCCCLEKIISLVVICFLFFCSILSLNILITVVRALNQDA